METVRDDYEPKKSHMPVESKTDVYEELTKMAEDQSSNEWMSDSHIALQLAKPIVDHPLTDTCSYT